MSKYVVYVTNPDDQRNLPGLSFTSGRYGWTLVSASMEAAIANAVERARAEGIYGADWSAKIDQIDSHGRPSRYGYDAVIVYLSDNPPAYFAAWGLPYTRIAGGGVRA